MIEPTVDRECERRGWRKGLLAKAAVASGVLILGGLAAGATALNKLENEEEKLWLLKQRSAMLTHPPGPAPNPPPRPHAVPTAELSSCQSSMTCSQFLVQQCSPANVAGGFSFQAEPRETLEECLANNEAVEVAFQACVDEGLLPLAGVGWVCDPGFIMTL